MMKKMNLRKVAMMTTAMTLMIPFVAGCGSSESGEGSSDSTE